MLWSELWHRVVGKWVPAFAEPSTPTFSPKDRVAYFFEVLVPV